MQILTKTYKTRNTRFCAQKGNKMNSKKKKTENQRRLIQKICEC